MGFAGSGGVRIAADAAAAAGAGDFGNGEMGSGREAVCVVAVAVRCFKKTYNNNTRLVFSCSTTNLTSISSGNPSPS